MSNLYSDEILKKLHTAEVDILKDFICICEKYNLNYFAISGSAIGAVRHQGFIPWDDDIDIAILRKDYEVFAEVAPKELGDKYDFWGPENDLKYYNLQPIMSRKGTTFVTDEAWAGGYRPGIFLDIFIYENIPDDEVEANVIIKKCKRYKILYLIRNINFFKLLKNQTVVNKIKYIISGFIRLVLRLIPNSDVKLYNLYLKYAKKYYGKSDRYTALCDPGAAIMDVYEEDIYPPCHMPFEDININMLHNYEKQLKKHMGEDYMTLPPENKRVNHSPKELDFGDVYR